MASIHLILSHNLPVVGRGLLMLFGADFLDYPVGLVLVLHLVSVALVAVAVAVTAWHFLADLDLVAQLLLAGIVVNLAVFIVSSQRVLAADDARGRRGAPVRRGAGRTAARPAAGRRARRPARPGRPGRPGGRGGRAGWLVALGLVGVGYAVGLVRQLTPHVPVSSQQRLADWLAARHLDNGLAGYWQSAVIAPMSEAASRSGRSTSTTG